RSCHAPIQTVVSTARVYVPPAQPATPGRRPCRSRPATLVSAETSDHEPAAVAGTVTAFVTSTLSLGIGLAWWQSTQFLNAVPQGRWRSASRPRRTWSGLRDFPLGQRDT